MREVMKKGDEKRMVKPGVDQIKYTKKIIYAHDVY